MRAVRRRCLLQQVAGLLTVQTEADHLPMTQRLTAVYTGIGQGVADTVQLLLPPCKLCRQLFMAGIGAQLRRPVLQGAGFFRQRLTGISRLQVFKQHPPRHAVHHQMVDHQQ